MSSLGQKERVQEGAAAPEVVSLVEATGVGGHDEDALADVLCAQCAVAQALTVTVRGRHRVDVYAAALCHVVIHQLGEAVRVVADCAWPREGRCGLSWIEKPGPS